VGRPAIIVTIVLDKPASSIIKVEEIKKEATGSSESLIKFYETVWHHVPEDLLNH
jgi:hypothetical protein